MTDKRSLSALFLTLALGLASHATLAETAQFGRFEVIYSVVNSTFVEPDVAETYRLVRAKDRAFVNIAIREQLADGSDRAVSARIEGRSWDLFQNTFLEFQEIREGPAIYYIADFEFSDEQVRFFDLTLLPEGAARSETLRFQQKIYEE
jgi:hypothetical protein